MSLATHFWKESGRAINSRVRPSPPPSPLAPSLCVREKQRCDIPLLPRTVCQLLSRFPLCQPFSGFPFSLICSASTVSKKICVKNRGKTGGRNIVFAPPPRWKPCEHLTLHFNKSPRRSTWSIVDSQQYGMAATFQY